MKKQIVKSSLYIMFFFFCFYLLTTYSNDKVNAETRSTNDIFLDSSKWKVTFEKTTYVINSDVTYKESYDLSATKIDFNLGKGYIRLEPGTDVIGLWIWEQSYGNYYDQWTQTWKTRVYTAKLSQTVPLEKGRYYQFKAKYELSYRTALPNYDHDVGYMDIVGISGKKFIMSANNSELAKGMVNAVHTVKAPETKNYEFQQKFIAPYDGEADGVYADARWFISDITYKDVTNEWLTLKDRINGLFINVEQKELKLSTTTQMVKELKKEVEDFDSILTPTDKMSLENVLTKAQTLLNKINVTITTGELVDNPEQQESYTLVGKTYPNAFLSFSGSASLPEGQLSSEVKGDTSNYQIRANNDGAFSYRLPRDSYFKAGEKVEVKSMLNGKFATVTKTVQDTTPPEAPKLDSVADISSSFSGDAEPNATINLYESGTNVVFLTGKVDDKGRFDLRIPEERKPLIPYKNYEVTATDGGGNTSVFSNTQQVKDTIPPSAEAILQYVSIGSEIPNVSTMIKNIYDNAGSEAVTKMLIKEPDLTKVGRATAIVELMDKAQNKTPIEVPFLVESPDVVKDGTYMLYGESFSALAVDYPDTEKEQIEFILANSKGNAWELSTAKERKGLISVDKTSVQKAAGTYELSLSIGAITKKITMTLLPGTLGIKKHSTDISFGEVTIKSKRQNIMQQKAVELTIEDTRIIKNQWRLTAQLTDLFQNAKGEKESGLGLYVKEIGHEIIPINSQVANEVFNSKESDKREVGILFSESSRSLNLEVMPGKILKEIAYTTKINWTIENGP
ncbi:Ig-like domain-containing protein [Candidatus Enterococcus mansonii]|uniref:Bacterial Ig domain-containing protein n=1 Tax=Candidatus Enterococcus mansonii TaxID=1834181 RepID=A0A242C6H4_9ENTE|nr:Ig-like domain-containing protein [Enterococcus sp. 4G2_DIV0659]OTO05857.1 hypothetical protein A5880_003032 [Enterococcus sp. 4G2_DIV0659]